uniref:Uncharacterized protein n=1 Tax=Nelumbo nucifera TaxID=4432 RepID=A0A822ZVC0_NELNU|nr:TPA_asm: hypothetical protein HUJ06_018880 [Nelumbo nucifera]
MLSNIMNQSSATFLMTYVDFYINSFQVMGYSDTDVAEYLFRSKPQIDVLVKFLCNDLTKTCAVEPPPVPKDRNPGEPFIPKSSKEAEMEKILRSMEGMPGAPSMKMYSREDLMNMQNFGDEDNDDDDDDDDDEEDFPSKLGKVLRTIETTKSDWKQRIMKGITDTGAALRWHANKVAFRIRRWWQGKKTQVAKQPSKAKAEL